MRVHLKHLVFRFYKSFFKSQGLTQIEIEPLNHTSEEKEAEGDIFQGSNDIRNLKPHGLCCGRLQIRRRWVINVGIWKNFRKWEHEMEEKGLTQRSAGTPTTGLIGPRLSWNTTASRARPTFRTIGLARTRVRRGAKCRAWRV